MKRPSALLGSAFFLVLAPGTVAGFVPWYLCRWEVAPPLLGFAAFRVTGALFILGGLPVLLDSFARFALQGLGTPAPLAPTEHLVVSGFYSYVRNPMYVAVFSLVLGQGLLFGSVNVLAYAAFLWLLFTAFVISYEEPTLRRTFGRQYADYCAHVGRWIPRLRPYHAPS
ncbi:MAG TPA: isoprenylcysteine carboxylmethyltransferase family protein [Gammaproteobacteria bacterium]|nr:isoprenylcysteine carboxylmethyltransferase family protein [Gammaproteobacteria bacterium]